MLSLWACALVTTENHTLRKLENHFLIIEATGAEKIGINTLK
jgi:hypothetical protein